MRKQVPDKPAGLMQYIEVDFPFNKVGMDLIGPFLDYLTKWAETGALPNGTAEEAAQFFVKNVVLRHGTPQTLITDRGKCFIAELTQKVLALLEISHYQTTSYHPQTNGLCERLNHTLSDMISMYVDSDHKNWDSVLPYVTFAYNTSRQESTAQTPFFMLYGREVTFPQDLEFNVINQSERIPSTHEQISDKFKKARDFVVKRLHQVHLKQKENYDKTRRDVSYSDGDLVLVYKPIRKVGKSEKLLHRWLGPFKIVRRTSEVNYEVQKIKSKNDKTDIVHVTNLKKFNVADVLQTTPPPRKEISQEKSQSTLPPTKESEAKRRPGRPKKTDPRPSQIQLPELMVNNRPTRTHRPPRKLGFMQALFPLLLFGLVLSDPPISNGIYFKKERPIIFSDSEWIISTEITFSHLQQSINHLRYHLNSRFWNKLQHGEHYNRPTEARSLLRLYAQQKTNTSLAFLNDIEDQLGQANDMIGINNIRKPRGLIDLGGDVLKWLFGTVTNNDLENINRRLHLNAKTNEDIVHSIEEQASLVSESLRRTHLNTEILGEIRKALSNVDQEILYNSHNIQEFNSIMTQLSTSFLQVDRHLQEIQSHVSQIKLALDWLSHGLLPMELFKPKRYLQILQGIDKKLAGTQRLIIPATADNMWIYYQQTKVTTAVVQNSKTQQESLKLFLHVPMYKTPYQFELHKVYNIPTFNSYSIHGLHYENIPEYIDISTDLDKYLELNTEEIEQCTEINNRWMYPIMKGFRRITNLNTTQSCIVALFQNSTSKNKLCTQVLTPWNGFYSHYLGKGKWLYSNLQETSVTYTCLDAKVKKLYTAIIDKSSLLKPPKGCTIRSSNWILPPTFKKQLIVPRPDTIDSIKIPDIDS